MLMFTKKDGTTPIPNPLEVHAAADKKTKNKRIYLTNAGGDRNKITLVSNNPTVVSAKLSERLFDGAKGMWTVDLQIGDVGSAIVTAVHAPDATTLVVNVGERFGVIANEPYKMLALLFLAENPTPEDAGYNAAEVVMSMQWMRIVIENRRPDPQRFGAVNGTYAGIVTAKGQFAGFEGYPTIAKKQMTRLDQIIDRANDDEHPKQAAYGQLVQWANFVAVMAKPEDPCTTGLYGWRTAGSSAPGGDFEEYRQKAGNQFYTLKSKKKKK